MISFGNAGWQQNRPVGLFGPPCSLWQLLNVNQIEVYLSSNLFHLYPLRKDDA